MSVELWIATEGECTCGVPYSPENPPPTHDHHVVCDLGVIEYPEPRPDRDEVGHLMLTSAEYVADLIANGPKVRRIGRTDSATHTVDRLFAHSVDETGRRWTWELFDAHWRDGKDNGLHWLLGRWPD